MKQPHTNGGALAVSARAVVVAAALAGILGACQGSGTLQAHDREVLEPLANVEWRAGTSSDVPGLYSSTSISGPAAAVLVEVHYRFDPNGTFTGAALILLSSHAYTVLTGEWRVEDGQLYLSADGEPARLEVAGDLVRLSGTEGVVVLERRSAP